MSPSHPHTVGAAESFSPMEEEELCPVCDGECTCPERPAASLTSSYHPISAATVSTASELSSNISSPLTSTAVPKQILKIKLTVPPGMLGKRKHRASTSSASVSTEETTLEGGNDGDIAPSVPISVPVTQEKAPKRRGRPPKSITTLSAVSTPVRTASQSLPPRRSKVAPRSSVSRTKPRVRRGATVPNFAGRKTSIPSVSARKRTSQIHESESSELSDISDDDDGQSVQFPTFVSASAISSGSSDDPDGSSSAFDSDSSIEGEEEDFIISEESARMRREMFLNDSAHGRRRDVHHNEWEIRPRQMSVEASSDVEMDADSDGTEDEEQDDEDDGDEDEDDETDERGPQYTGLATGWTDEEEDTFDADVFFANLSDSSTSSDAGSEGGQQFDINHASPAEDSAPRPTRQHLPFEVTEGWDGQIVFTNGDGEGYLQSAFELEASLFTTEEETAASPRRGSEDAEMTSTDADEGGYEQDCDELDEDCDGDTTDEDLVGEDRLPNERAMRLFNTPFVVSSINPLFTVTPAGSPAGKGRRLLVSGNASGSPKPADVLAGNVFWDDELDDFDEDDRDSRVASSAKGGLPRLGEFDVTEETHQAIIDDAHKEVPSPHPRQSHRRSNLSHSYTFSQDGIRTMFCKNSQSFRTSSLPPTIRSPLQLVSSSDMDTASDLPAETMELDDVLDSSFLDSEAASDHCDESSSTTAACDNDGRKHIRNLSRWDLISVGAFRKRGEGGVLSEHAGWGSEPPGVSMPTRDYGTVIKSSPLNTMLWSNRQAKQSPPDLHLALSPLLGAQHDGDRTPTHLHSSPVIPPSIPSSKRKDRKNKVRKDLYQDRKNRKSLGPVHHHHQHHQHRQYRQHFPNAKTRSHSGTQRTNFFSSPMTPSST